MTHSLTASTIDNAIVHQGALACYTRGIPGLLWLLGLPWGSLGSTIAGESSATRVGASEHCSKTGAVPVELGVGLFGVVPAQPQLGSGHPRKARVTVTANKGELCSASAAKSTVHVRLAKPQT